MSTWAVIDTLGPTGIQKFQTLISSGLAFFSAAAGLFIVLLRRAYEEIDSSEAKIEQRIRENISAYKNEKASCAILLGYIGKISYVLPSRYELIKTTKINIDDKTFNNEFLNKIHPIIVVYYSSAINRVESVVSLLGEVEIEDEDTKVNAQKYIDDAHEVLETAENLLRIVALRDVDRSTSDPAPLTDEEANDFVIRALAKAASARKQRDARTAAFRARVRSGGGGSI